jgi:very-short-patch-repair endonuclease
MGIVIELDGKQHVEFIEHFHKDANGFRWQQFKDKKKDRKAEESGIKLIRILQSECPKSKEELKAIIDSVPYPDIEYDFNSIMKESEKPILKKAREIRAKRYREQKQKSVVDRNAT